MPDLARGANVAINAVRLDVAVAGARPGSVDLMVFQLGSTRRVRSDADFIFFNQPASPEGAVRLSGPDRLSIELTGIPAEVETLAVAVALDDSVASSLASIPGLGVSVAGSGEPVNATAAGLTVERAAVLIEVYRRAGGWKLRNVSAGWAAGLAALAREHGVQIDEAAPAPEPAPAAREQTPAARAVPAPQVQAPPASSAPEPVSRPPTHRPTPFPEYGGFVPRPLPTHYPTPFPVPGAPVPPLPTHQPTPFPNLPAAPGGW